MTFWVNKNLQQVIPFLARHMLAHMLICMMQHIVSHLKSTLGSRKSLSNIIIMGKPNTFWSSTISTNQKLPLLLITFVVLFHLPFSLKPFPLLSLLFFLSSFSLARSLPCTCNNLSLSIFSRFSSSVLVRQMQTLFFKSISDWIFLTSLAITISWICVIC